jgi:hypothetical protein
MGERAGVESGSLGSEETVEFYEAPDEAFESIVGRITRERG